MPLLNVENLSVSFKSEEGVTTPVRGISFSIKPKETLAIVGESGSGKSVTNLAIMGLLPPSAKISSDEFRFSETMQRGKDMTMIFQEPMTSLNPLLKVGEQIAEVTRLHLKLTRQEAWANAINLLEKVEINQAALVADKYPHQLSGGMRQRAMIAMAIACKPKLLIADEPTTALDVTVQAQILTLLHRLQQEVGMAIIFITHNLGVVAQIADRVAVVYAGEIVEYAMKQDIFENPRHPYTKALLACLPSRAVKTASGKRVITSIKGQVSMAEQGCSFAPRCGFSKANCFIDKPLLVNGVRCHYSEALS